MEFVTGGYQGVKKALCIILVVAALTICFASSAFAGGDKVMGEKGQGEVNQVQVQDTPPFQ